MFFLIKDKRDFYRKVSERSYRYLNTKKNFKSNYKGYRYNNAYKGRNNRKNSFKDKFIMQCVICIFIVVVFYIFIKNDSEFSKNMIEKTANVLNNNTKFEEFKKGLNSITQKFNIKPNIVIGEDSKIELDNGTFEKMEEEIDLGKKK